MRLRAHRRNLVVWSSSAGPADRNTALTFIRIGPAGRMQRLVRTGTLLMVISLLGVGRVIRPRWRPLLPGLVLTLAGLPLRGGAWGVILLPGLLLLLSAPLIPASANADHKRLERELAAYATQSQRCDLEATLARYPDTATHELRDILASQAPPAPRVAVPGGEPKLR